MICLDLLTNVHYCNCMTWYQVIRAWLVNGEDTLVLRCFIYIRNNRQALETYSACIWNEHLENYWIQTFHLCVSLNLQNSKHCYIYIGNNSQALETYSTCTDRLYWAPKPLPNIAHKVLAYAKERARTLREKILKTHPHIKYSHAYFLVVLNAGLYNSLYITTPTSHIKHLYTILTNSKTYGTQRFNVSFTRAHQ